LQNKIKPIALYLPQFHPIPENDRWWGKGFTEWTNVSKAKPLFEGHWQPRLPADLGFYDLRVPETREAQASLAKQFGIYGFCYWHYWFAGKRIIERPFQDVVKTGKPDFPFCLAWANQTWSGNWHGLSNKKILIEQTYPGIQDYTDHFYSIIEALHDKRYIEVNGKKVFFIFRPMEIPDAFAFINCWQTLAIREGMKGFHFVGMHMPWNWIPSDFGYDAMVQNWLSRDKLKAHSFTDRIRNKLVHSKRFIFKSQKEHLPNIISYKKYVDNYPENKVGQHEYPLIYTDWDNTPRAGKDGWLFQGTSPELFEEICMKAFRETANKQNEEKFVVVKSWNEWAEGNYLEPDSKHGISYLQSFRSALNFFENSVK
jgi:hypothetical protein